MEEVESEPCCLTRNGGTSAEESSHRLLDGKNAMNQDV